MDARRIDAAVLAARIVTASGKAVALGGVGPRHARRPEAADGWPTNHSLHGHS
jgi:hypothetical protein